MQIYWKETTMSKFNAVKTPVNKTTNLAGGDAYKESNKLALASLLVTSFLTDKAYESEAQLTKRLETLYKALDTEDKTFFAKAAIYARDKFNLRSISHLAAAMVGEGVASDKYSEEDKKWLTNFFSKIIVRGDDVTEIISAYKARPQAFKSKKGRIQLVNVMKKGFSAAMGRMDTYQLAKYRGEGKETSLADAVRMSHVVATKKNKEGLEKLIAGTLRNETTWEAKQTKAGQAGATLIDDAERAKVVEKAKAEAWSDFVAKGDRIEYMALLRNIRNIVEQADEDTITKALELLVKPELIAKSRQLPFRFYTALTEISKSVSRRDVINALNKALDLSVSNVPVFPGKTAILVDVSGSMRCAACSTMNNIHVDTIAGLFAAALYKQNDSQIVLFGSRIFEEKFNPADSISTIAEKCHARNSGTNIGAAFDSLKDKFDRIIILSDMQTWGEKFCSQFYFEGDDTNKAFKRYAKKHNPQVKLYSFDLAGNGTIQFPEKNVFAVAGLSDHTFEIMSKMEEDKQYMIHEIEAIEL